MKLAVALLLAPAAAYVPLRASMQRASTLTLTWRRPRGQMRRSAAATPAAGVRYLLVVNDCDVVPRLLGAPMPVATAGLLAGAAACLRDLRARKRRVHSLPLPFVIAHIYPNHRD